MMDVRTLGIERDWFEIAQDRQQWSSFCEQIHFCIDVGEVCAVNRPHSTFTGTCGRTFKHPGGHLKKKKKSIKFNMNLAFSPYIQAIFTT